MGRKVRISATADPLASARAAGLVYTTDDRPGIRRIGRGQAFRYVDARQRPVRNAADLRAHPRRWSFRRRGPTSGFARIRAATCRRPAATPAAASSTAITRNGAQVRDSTKYERLIAFGRALPVIRRRTDADLRRDGLPREKVLAAVVRLLEKTFIRVGNDEYARDNQSFGLTTMRDGHVQDLRLHGPLHLSRQVRRRARAGARRSPPREDRQAVPRSARPGAVPVPRRERRRGRHRIRRRQCLPEGHHRERTSRRRTSGPGLGRCSRRSCCATSRQVDSEARAKKNVVAAIEQVAKQLGNTRAVCRKCYVHPAVIDAYLDGSMMRTSRSGRSGRRRRWGR